MMKTNKVITRFAPSPTGNLHIGSVRSAILNWIYSIKFNGDFVLRIDDTDVERCKNEFVESIKNDLKWLGINWSSTFKQSERLSIYEKNINFLKENNRIYECFESSEELSLKRKSLLSSGKPPIYDRSALKLTKMEKEELKAKGKKSHWRFFLEDEKISWDDLIRKEVIFEQHNLSDPVIIREDGTLLYHLPSVVDDIDSKITNIIRGEDHVTNTAFHIQLFKALGSNIPNFGHHPLLLDSEGKGLGKRLGSLSIADLRKEGYNSITIINYLLTIGTSNNLSSEINKDNIIKSFKISHLARSSPKFNKADLSKINSNILKKIGFDSVKQELQDLGVVNPNHDFWELVKNNIDFIHDTKEWWKIISSKEIFYKNDKEFLNECSLVLPEEKFTINTWDKWIANIKKISQRKNKELFMPLRLSLTGKEKGPELKFLLPLLSRNLVLFRLTGKDYDN